MVVLERSPEGKPARTTVAIWPGPTEEEGRVGRWRLDRVIEYPIEPEDRFPLFEIVDERDPSKIHKYPPVWIEWDPTWKSWTLTDQWAEISEVRNSLGMRPFALREKMIGLMLALSGGYRLEPGWLFGNVSPASWLFVPAPVDKVLIDGAERLDLWIAKHPDLFDRTGPDERTMSTWLDRKVEVRDVGGPTKYWLCPSKSEAFRTRIEWSRFAPHWSVYPFDSGRLMGGSMNSLRDAIETAVKNGGLVYEDQSNEWLEKNSEIPKLLLGEDLEVYQMLGEELPIFWDDRRFIEWVDGRI